MSFGGGRAALVAGWDDRILVYDMPPPQWELRRDSRAVV